MALLVNQGVPTLFFRRSSYERAGLTRAALDARLGLTDAEFRVEGTLVAVGPIYDVDALGMLVDELEKIGLVYYDDYFELSGSWPDWLDVLVRTSQSDEATEASLARPSDSPASLALDATCRATHTRNTNSFEIAAGLDSGTVSARAGSRR